MYHTYSRAAPAGGPVDYVTNYDTRYSYYTDCTRPYLPMPYPKITELARSGSYSVHTLALRAICTLFRSRSAVLPPPVPPSCVPNLLLASAEVLAMMDGLKGVVLW